MPLIAERLEMLPPRQPPLADGHGRLGIYTYLHRERESYISTKRECVSLNSRMERNREERKVGG